MNEFAVYREYKNRLSKEILERSLSLAKAHGLTLEEYRFRSGYIAALDAALEMIRDAMKDVVEDD